MRHTQVRSTHLPHTCSSTPSATPQRQHYLAVKDWHVDDGSKHSLMKFKLGWGSGRAWDGGRGGASLGAGSPSHLTSQT